MVGSKSSTVFNESMKKKVIQTLILLVTALPLVQAQDIEGIVNYERKTYWTKLIAKLPFLSQEEKDRAKMMWGNDDEEKTKLKLVFTPAQSVYTYEGEQGETDDGRWSWRQDDYLVQRDFDKETITEWHEMGGKTYVIQDSLKIPKWKILNQLKDVAGHVCMKAEMEDPANQQKIVAWFADDLPVSAGPERLFGLPGVILELDYNDGVTVVTATKIDLKKVEPKQLALPKMKGKKINLAERDRIIKEHIKDSIKAQRNPYWGIKPWN